MNTNLLIDCNNYEFNKDSRNGVYIIHGFTNSTYENKELAEFLGDQGFYTKTNNLPGHGTTPEECNRYKYKDWIEFVEKDVAEMSTKCDKISVIGISMGSVLAMHLSTIFPVNAAVYASIALIYKQKIGMNILAPLLHRFISFRYKKYSYPKDIREKINFMGYKVWPISGLNEVRKLTNQVKKQLSTIKCPVLLVHSKSDLLTKTENLDFAYNSISSLNKEKFIVNNAGHNLFIQNPDQKLIFEKISSFLKDANQTNI